MEILFIYLLKSAGILLIFLLGYQLFLKHETYFTHNRIYFIAGLLLSLLLPLISFTKTEYINATVSTSALTETTKALATNNPNSINWTLILFVVYLVGVCFWIVKLIFQFSSLNTILNHGKQIKKDKFTLVEINTAISPFSFFNYIVYNPNHFSEKELQLILTHEETHVLEKHSLDILLINIMTVFQWCNPIIWLYKQTMAQNLEYCADLATLTDNKKEYQYLLLKTHINSDNSALLNPFFKSSIKKRILMLQQTPSKKTNLLKYAFILPALGFFMYSFNYKKEIVIKEFNKTLIENNGINKYYDTIVSSTKKDKELKIKNKKLLHNTSKNMFPFQNNSKLTDKKTQIIDTTEQEKKDKAQNNEQFIVTRNVQTGKKDTFNITIKSNSPSPQETQNGILIRNTITIDKDQLIATDQLQITAKPTNRTIRIGQEIPPLIIIDGKESTDRVMKALDPNKIESISVFKDEKAIEAYGEKGKNGVIVILTKNPTIIPITVPSTPLFIVDGKETTETAVKKIDPHTIESMTVLKGEKDTKKYGEKGKNGVVLILLKKK